MITEVNEIYIRREESIYTGQKKVRDKNKNKNGKTRMHRRREETKMYNKIQRYEVLK